MKGDTIFKNKLVKLQTSYRFGKHQGHLRQIARRSHSKHIVREPYKQLLNQNAKRTYLDDIKKTQIDLENRILLEKISKIQSSPPSKQFWLKDRSHSLNQTIRKESLKSIKEENKRMFDKIINQRPSIRYEELLKNSLSQSRRANNISMMEKYKLPEIRDQKFENLGRSISSIDHYKKQQKSKINMNLSFRDHFGRSSEHSKKEKYGPENEGENQQTNQCDT